MGGEWGEFPRACSWTRTQQQGWRIYFLNTFVNEALSVFPENAIF